MDRRANDGTLLPGPTLLVPGHLLAPFGWAALSLAALTQSRQHLLKDLFELDRPRMHVIGLALTYLDVDQFAISAPLLLTAPLRDAVHCILGRCPSSIQRVLRRLPSAVLSPEAYKSLIELLDDSRSARVLYYLDETELTDPTIRVLRALPAALRPTLTAIVNHVWLLDGLPAGLDWLARRRGNLNFDQLVDDLARQSQPAQLIARLNKLVGELPLPDRLPPKTIGQGMRIDTTAEICALAKEFKNCLISYTGQVDDGTSFIYLWDGPGLRAICHVARHGRLGWSLDEALGPRNAALNSDDWERIADAFAQAGIPASRLFHAIESIMRASAARAQRRLQSRAHEEQDDIWLVE
jgi:hypothetical protein